MAYVIPKSMIKALEAGETELKEWLNDSGFAKDDEGFWVDDNGDHPELVLQDLVDFFVFGANWQKSQNKKSNSEQNDERSVATEVDSSNADGKQTKNI